VNNPIEIVLSSIHVGEARRVVTLGINGKDRADKFLTKLRKDDRKEQNTDIQTAKAIQSAYFGAKELHDTRIILKEPKL
jgi:hypothetical protein